MAPGGEGDLLDGVYALVLCLSDDGFLCESTRLRGPKSGEEWTRPGVLFTRPGVTGET